MRRRLRHTPHVRLRLSGRLRHATLILALAAPMLTGRVAPATGDSRISPDLARAIAQDPTRDAAVWVFLTDRAGAEYAPDVLAAARRGVSERALARRALRGQIRDAVVSDLPIHPAYENALVARGARIRGTSRWLNAASVQIPVGLALELARLPFVARLSLVARGVTHRPDPVLDEPDRPVGESMTVSAPTPSRSALASAPGDTAYYGGSFRQLDMLQVPALHALGLSGAGVLVCMFDGGFETSHEVFAGLNIVAKRDFVHGDTIVADEAGQDAPGTQNHGSWTLGCVAGHKPGTYSGSAFGASVALAKTEDDASETPVEMDYWQFAVEWADSLGADIISSSLAYSEFDNAADSYTYADMDGRTTVVTLAAAEAARRGIVVVNAAGNSGTLDWHYIEAPADADSILAVGAVDSFNVIQAFSSHGPTADGRVKPDVTAMGRRVLVTIGPPGPGNTYQRQSGTSFSAPLVSGVAALLLQSHSTWTPVDVRNAMRHTALNQATPDNDMGWGLVQGLAANAWNPLTGVPSPGPGITDLALSAGPNPLRAGVSGRIRFSAPASNHVTLELVDLSGRRRARLYSGSGGESRTVEWRARGGDGAALAAGVYWIRLAIDGLPTRTEAVRVVVLR
jgi:serine protease AprX